MTVYDMLQKLHTTCLGEDIRDISWFKPHNGNALEDDGEIIF
jgi:hypothetical protein